MLRNFFLQTLFISIGIALLFAGLFFDMRGVVAQTATSTPDRLAQPTLPALPSQADNGAQVFWLSCLPCHGDRGQGLTEEFKQTYPPEDRNCWESGCHGNRPYENGFTLPQTVPAIIGEGTLQKFPNAFVLRSYIFAAMPYWRPASLTEDETWQVTAFILRENKKWIADTDLNEFNAPDILLALPTPAPAPSPVPDSFAAQKSSSIFILILLASGVLILILFFTIRYLRKNKESF